jgi:HK97 family phage major capsid protein
MEHNDELLELARELRTTVAERFGKLERRLDRLEGDHPAGYLPGDHGSGDGFGPSPLRPSTGLELHRGESWSAWAVRHGQRVVDREQFSLDKVVRAMLTGDRSGLTEVERQALAEGSDATGGILIGDELAGTIIDLVRAKTVVVQAGATVLPMAGDSLTWPKVIAGATPKWKAELAPMEESEIQFGALQFQAKTLRTVVKLSQELVEDLPAEGSDAITRELTAAFALEVDRVALLGSGTDPEPLGVANTPGVPVDAAIGDPENYDFVAELVSTVRIANHSPTAVIYGEQTAGALDTLKATDNQPLQPPRSVAALPQLTTNLVGQYAFAGEWPLLVLAVRPQLGVRIRQIDAGLADDFSQEIVAWQRIDVGLVDPAAFAVASGIAPVTATTTAKTSKSS